MSAYIQALPVGIFWDMDSCTVPENKSASDMIKCLRNFFVVNQPNRCLSELVITANTTILKAEVSADIYMAGGVTFYPSNSSIKNDNRFQESVRKFFFTHVIYENSFLVLLSGDVDFVNELRAFKTRRGFHVILIHAPNCSPQFKVGWNELYCFATFCSEVKDKGEPQRPAQFNRRTNAQNQRNNPRQPFPVSFPQNGQLIALPPHNGIPIAPPLRNGQPNAPQRPHQLTLQQHQPITQQHQPIPQQHQPIPQQHQSSFVLRQPNGETVTVNPQQRQVQQTATLSRQHQGQSFPVRQHQSFPVPQSVPVPLQHEAPQSNCGNESQPPTNESNESLQSIQQQQQPEQYEQQSEQYKQPEQHQQPEPNQQQPEQYEEELLHQPPQQNDHAQPSKNVDKFILLVEGLSDNIDYKILKENLQNEAVRINGKVKYVKNGQAFITFKNKNNAKRAVQFFNETTIFGRSLSVSFTKSIPYDWTVEKERAREANNSWDRDTDNSPDSCSVQ